MPKAHHRDYSRKESRLEKKSSRGFSFGKIFPLIILFVLFVVFIQQANKSIVYGEITRVNLLALSGDGGVKVVSVDPVDRVFTVIDIPQELEIKSRSVGSYKVGNLYKLGEYEGDVGEFAKRKMQGFLRIPVKGFYLYRSENLRGEFLLLVKDSFGNSGVSNLSFLDRVILLIKSLIYRVDTVSSDELYREGVLVSENGGLNYSDSKLYNYVQRKFVDWKVGEEGVSSTVINSSGEEGLGNDVSRFLTNIGMNVVNVREGNKQGESKILVSDKEILETHTFELISEFLGIFQVEVTNTDEYRADIVLIVGSDLKSIF